MAIGERVCTVCSSVFYGSIRALYCSNKCKQSEYRRIERTSGYIYKLVKDGDVVYVGQSSNEKELQKRITHHKLKSSGKDFDNWYFYKVSGEKLSEVEAKEILHLSPIYNKSIPGNGKYITVKKAVKICDQFMYDLIKNNCETYILENKPALDSCYVNIESVEIFKDRLINFLMLDQDNKAKAK